MRTIVVAAVLGTMLATAACGGGGGNSGERILHLATGPKTEAQVIQDWRVMLANPNARMIYCDGIAGLSRDAAIVTLRAIVRANAPSDFATQADASEKDRDYAAGLLYDECQRFPD